MPAVTDARPLAFAGFPASAWAFALRIWLAFVGALYVSFWLQLDAAYSSALTVALVAVPTRGQTMEKAVFRLLGTVIGCAASIAIVGLFAQTEVLLLAAISAWIGACIYMAALLDGNRASMAGIGLVTVALVVLEHLEDPQDIFDAVTGRGAALIIGILAVAVVNDLSAAPDYYPRVLAQLSDLHRRIASYAERPAGGELLPPTMAADLLRELTLLRSDITGLATESSAGPARSAAARAAMVNLAAMFAVARALGGLPSNSPCASTLTDELRRKHDEVLDNLSSLSAGCHPARERQAPVYRSRRIALAGGVRAACYFVLAAVFFVIAGWPAADTALALLVIPINLSATVVDPTVTTRVSVIAAPIACLFGGLLKFVVLGGVSAFPLLALALAPFVMGSALLMARPNPLLAGVGRLNVVFIVLLLQPSNPQSYDPQAFLISCLFLLLATLLLFAIQIVLPPLSGDRRILWLERSARRDLDALAAGAPTRLTPEEAAYRDAARIGEIMTAGGSAPQNHTAVAEALACFDRAARMRLCANRPVSKREP